MTVVGGQWAGGQPAGGQAATPSLDDAANAWRAARASADIQFTPLPDLKVPPPAPPPPWLLRMIQALGHALEAVLAPIGRMLGMSWPIFQYVLIVLVALLAVVLLWQVLAPMAERWRNRGSAEAVPEWTPDRAEAMALLEDADRLAAEGRFAEATHLLLRRSVRQIADARPDWLRPASTAREIAALALLPEAGRRAFGVIAQRVERALFALRDLDAQDWAAARAAYADFALVRLHA